MSDNLKKYSFQDLLKQGQIRIPKIQRDYAQGRQNQRVNEIRKTFVHTLILVVKGKRSATELDFVYGSNNADAFEPLDGQQRLTTLFLLHWMLGVDLRSTDEKKHAIFTYETRNTSKEFCDELVQHDAIQFVNEAKQKTDVKEVFKPSEIIKGRDWFKWEWKYDPTILSMLVMIDAIYDEMGSDWDKDLDSYRKNLDNITFNLLNLGEFGLSNELFIKMNARGKQLSDFDKLKSTLEEELQLQQKEFDVNGSRLASQRDEENWRTLIDGAWIDLFWHKYARKIITDTEFSTEDERKKAHLKAAESSELQFKKLLLRLIALQFFEQNPSSESLREAAYQLDEDGIDNLITVYLDSLIDLRSDEQYHTIPEGQITLSFQRLIDDFNLLIYKDSNDTFYEISYLLPQISHIDKNDSSLFDSFLGKKVANDVELIFYGMLLFLREFPPQKSKSDIEKYAWSFEKAQHQDWLKNLEDWVRSLRNILLNDNNNQRIDKIQFSLEATQSLKKMISDFVVFVDSRALNLESDNTIVLQFFQSLRNKTYVRLDNQSLLEEIDKAELKLSDIKWYSSIEKVENHHYLWGQIRCLLSWSNKDRLLFDNYGTRLLSLLNYIGENSLKYYAAILAFSPNCWHESNRLFLYNKVRDNSFKRYLREHSKEGQTYGATIKALIDNWMLEYPKSSVEEFIEALIAKGIATAKPWVRCILKFPNILNEAWDKRLYESNGYVILAQRKTLDSHCFDPILLYLRETYKANGLESSCKLYDSKADYTHGFELKINDHKYLVLWSGNGLYSIQNGEMPVLREVSADEMLTYMENIMQTFSEA